MQLKQLRQIVTKSKGLSKKNNFRTNLVHNVTTKKLNLTSQSYSSFNKTQQRLKANHTLPNFQQKSFTPKYNQLVKQFRKFSSDDSTEDSAESLLDNYLYGDDRSLTPEHKKEIEDGVRKVFTPTLIRSLSKQEKIRDQIVFRWSKAMKRLLPLGGASDGNILKLFWNNEEALTSIWQDIDNAKKKVWLETYTIGPDRIGLKTIKKLSNAKKRGCEIKVMYDRVGSPDLFDFHFSELIQYGGSVRVFNELLNWPWRWRGMGLKRNHRKLVVVDDEFAHCGSMNLAEQYAGKLGTEYFRDTQIRIQGPAVKDIENVFQDSWNETDIAVDGYKIAPLPNLKFFRHSEENLEEGETGIRRHFVQVLQSNSLRNRKHIQRALRLTLNHANSHCFITAPYFIPPRKLSKAIQDASQRGVEIQVITSGLCDVPLVKMASTHILNLFLRKGVKIFAYQGKAIHSKTITIDGIYSSVGSFNLETWSHYYNLEVNLTTLGPDIAHQMENQFFEDLKSCQEITLDDLEKRPRWLQFIHWFIYFVFNLFYLIRKL